MRTWLEVFLVALRLGLTSFGGPVAHLGYFRDEYVVRRKWLDDRTYADLVALCQFLPGPASSQVGIGVGMLRAGLLGGIAAWLGFTLPSALALILFASGVAAWGAGESGWLHGLKVAAVAVVALAIWGMARVLCPDRERVSFAVLAAVTTIALPGVAGQVGVILLAGVAGRLLLPAVTPEALPPEPSPFRRRWGVAAWVVFFGLLFALPILRQVVGGHSLALVDAFYRAGSLVFGGGHVVLPLLQAEVVPPGWVTNEQFVAGYGAAQAVPGPLFTFSAYLGAISAVEPDGLAGGLIALGAIFLPSFLLIIGALPFWQALRSQAGIQAALRGINAAVVGLLLAAFYDPVWTSAIESAPDFGLALVLFALLAFWKLPPWLVVLLAAAAGALPAAAGVVPAT